jgi:Tol biopolymer transport system component
MDKDGEDKQPLTDGSDRNFMPVWSHDGASLVWTKLKSVEGNEMFGKKQGEGNYKFVIMFANFED